MYAVIFRAQIKALDDEYFAAASQLRDLAINRYGCTEFHSSTQGKQETAISYWPSLEAIRAWKADPRHLAAQESGRRSWYESYRVEVVKIEKSYGS